MSGYFVGIDSGGTMTKVALFDCSGAEIAVEVASNEMILPHPGWTERDAEVMWQAACTGIRTLLERNHILPDEILAVTPTGYGGGGYFVDESGVPTRNGVVSTDSRVLELLSRWDQDGLGARIRTCVQQQNWGGQSLSLIAWLDENEPEVAARTRYFLSCKDYLRLCLSGDISTDATDAGCAGLIDVASAEYSLEVLELAGIAHWREKLPPIGPSTDVVGGVTELAAKQTGLKVGTPVVRGVYDVVGCALATGFTSPDQLAAVAGTFSIHSTLHDVPCTDPLPTIQTPYPVNGFSIATMATPTSAINLEWVRNTFMSDVSAQIERQSGNFYDLCNEMISGTLGAPNNIQFFPFIFGGPDGAPAGMLGMTADTKMADILRAVYEGVVFAHRSDMEFLLGGSQSVKPNVVRLAGGPARSDVWVQMFADGLGLPIELAEGNELGAKGAAICAAVAVGVYDDIPQAIKEMVKVGRKYQPNLERSAELDAKYEIFKQLLPLISQSASGPVSVSASPTPNQNDCYA